MILILNRRQLQLFTHWLFHHRFRSVVHLVIAFVFILHAFDKVFFSEECPFHCQLVIHVYNWTVMICHCVLNTCSMFIENTEHFNYYISIFEVFYSNADSSNVNIMVPCYNKRKIIRLLCEIKRFPLLLVLCWYVLFYFAYISGNIFILFDNGQTYVLFTLV